MRGKEEAHDYRYFPDPDLLPLVIADGWIRSIADNLPELPNEKKKRFMEQYGLPSYDATLLTSDRELADYFENCVGLFPHPKQVSNWVMGALLGLLNTLGKPIDASPVNPENLARLLALVEEGVISGKIAKTVFDEMGQTGKPAEQIVEEKGLVQITDTDALADVVSDIISRHPKEVEAFKNGKTKLLGFFVGQVMRETKGKANPKLVNEILKGKLNA
jgi:aspartyl-tRNA(Asn)/glutamyl-tRNA(Gln) amidotransferase subunit B